VRGAACRSIKRVYASKPLDSRAEFS
jgi:hypothetical protein